ncbi:MAG: hypothetical protein K6F57_01855 [Candidatus Saccharibacteria bacterium]|nr:hypothetical protein [Candidatus Saccharibacteria bacterium]
MSDGFMADPIRPGDIKTEHNITDRPTIGGSNGSGGKIAVLIIFLIFVMPIVVFAFIFLRIWNDVGPDIVDQIKEEARNNVDYNGYYEITDEQQMAAARIFGAGILYEKGGPKSIAQSDCRHLKNAVTSFYNYNALPAQWYDNTYCSAGTVNVATYFIDENEDNLGGRFARIDIGPKDDKLGCFNIMFAENFRYIVTAKKLGHCNASKIEIKADGVNVPEITPQFESDGESDEEVEGPSSEKSRNVLRS